MARFFTTHWQFKYWESNSGGGGEAGSGSNLYLQRGVAPGDYVYVVSLSRGQLFLGMRLVVDQIVDRKTAVRRLKNQNLYDASEWIIGKRENATKFCSQRRLSPEVTKRLRFLSPSGEMKEPFFVSDTELDVQATRGVREITSGTAVLLEDIFELTDRHAGSVEPIVVGYDSLRMKIEARSEFDSILPNEVLQSERLLEGSVTEILVNRYERDAKARQQCLEIHGTACAVCFFDYAAKYGPEFAGFIHVHHLIPLSQIGREYRVDPLNDLVPICPNCHAAVHRRIPPFEIEELQRLMLDQIENRES